MTFMGTEPGTDLVYAKKLGEADREAVFEEVRAEWDERAEPWEAAYMGSIDDLIEPAEARVTLIRALHALERRSAQPQASVATLDFGGPAVP